MNWLFHLTILNGHVSRIMCFLKLKNSQLFTADYCSPMTSANFWKRK